MSWLELKIPPVALFGLVAIALAVLHGPDVLDTPLSPLRLSLSLLLMSLAALILIVSVRSFWRAQTTVLPMDPAQTSQLVVSGLYRYSRNPMYLAMALLLISESLLLNSTLGLFMTVGFVLWLTRFQIQPEERVLKRQFGAEFSEYCRRTRRWL